MRAYKLLNPYGEIDLKRGHIVFQQEGGFYKSSLIDFLSQEEVEEFPWAWSEISEDTIKQIIDYGKRM